MGLRGFIGLGLRPKPQPATRGDPCAPLRGRLAAPCATWGLLLMCPSSPSTFNRCLDLAPFPARSGPVSGRRQTGCGATWGLLALALAATAAGGCGGDASAPPASDAPEPAAIGTSEVTGHLPPRRSGLTTVVTLHPREPVDIPLPVEPAEMDQIGRAFVPRLVVVRAGQTVRFINSENDLHNVNVVDEAGEMLLNVGMPIAGGTYDHVFERAGDYRVRCNVHQEMAATVRVTDSPFIAIADRDGQFALPGVPYGAYDIQVRRGRERRSRPVSIDRPHVDLGSVW